MIRYRLMILALSFYVLGMTADVISSCHIPAYLHETNPYVRDAAYQFVPSLALAYYAVWFGLVAMISGIFYWGLRRFDEVLAQLAFAMLPILFGLGSFSAAIHNTWLRLGWYSL